MAIAHVSDVTNAATTVVYAVDKPELIVPVALVVPDTVLRLRDTDSCRIKNQPAERPLRIPHQGAIADQVVFVGC